MFAKFCKICQKHDRGSRKENWGRFPPAMGPAYSEAGRAASGVEPSSRSFSATAVSRAFPADRCCTASYYFGNVFKEMMKNEFLFRISKLDGVMGTSETIYITSG